MRRISYWCWIVCVMGSVSLLGYGQNSVILLNPEQIQDAAVNGLSIPTAGQYSVWGWSLDTLPLTVVLDETTLKIEPVEKAQPATYSWKNLGIFASQESKTVALRVFTIHSSQFLSQNSIGWLALSPDQEWSPDEWFDLSRVYPNTVTPSTDKRLGILRRIEQYYPFTHFQNKREWQERKPELRDHFLMSMGCFPMPPKAPLNPKVTGTIEHDDYTIENVYFESMPGFFATGNLYRPKGKTGPFPAILCPHGHWGEGRLTHIEENSIPGRCINFAKQGYIVFAIDMVGYLDSKQLTHKFAGPNEWLWGLTLHGLQFWNSVRAIDYLLTLDDVDPQRIACTGASGGGTQTYGLMAVDERIKVAAPVNMLSLHYQGGCLCENAPNLRIDMNNIELGALMAPRPLMMVSCTGDWTNETLRMEYPAMRSIYELYGKPEQLGVVQIDSGHNYNQQSREAVYAWFGKWLLGNDNKEDFKEQPFTIDPPETMHVFPDRLPDHAMTEQQLIDAWKAMSEEQLQSVFPDTQRSLIALRNRGENALRHALGVDKPGINDLVIDRVKAEKKGNLYVEKLLLGRKGVGDQIPVVVIVPSPLSLQASLLIHGQGKDAWFDPNTGKPGDILQSLLDQGQMVVMADAFMTGEYNTPFEPARRDTNTSQFLTYNQTETALRVQDILTAIAYMQSRYEAKRINLVGGGEAGLWSLLAASLAEELQSVVIDAAGFDSQDDRMFMEKLFVPGLRRAGDIRTAQALLAPKPLLIHNTDGKLDTRWAAAAYRTSDAVDLLTVQESTVTCEIIKDWFNKLTP